MNNKTTGQRIAEMREVKGFTQQAFSDAVGITRSYLSLLETDKRKIPSDILCSIANTLNVSSDYLICLSDVPSLDTNIQAVCEFTGLSEKALNEIRDVNSYRFKGMEGCPLSYPNEDSVALNLFLENPYVWDIVIQLNKLKEESKNDFCYEPLITEENWLDDSPKTEKLLQEDDALIEKKRNIYEKCDVIILRIYRYLKKIIDEYDKREYDENCEDFDFM